ncbi:MAG: amidase family protein [Patescibacteria group bacterium]
MKSNDLSKKTFLEINNLIENKQITIKEVNEYFQKQSSKVNPTLNIYVTVNDELSSEKLQIAVKDNFNTVGLKTTASAKVLDNYIAPYESTVTSRLKNAGIDILGKSNMDAWAHGSSTETSDYGPTKNPQNIETSPGGSSGGSAAAVAAGVSPAAIGSETAGSIRLPASWCGVVGLKPTYGRVSRYGVIAMGSSLDCPGPLTKSVEDAAYLLQLIAGHDPYDATSSDKPVPDYMTLTRSGKKYTIGVSDTYLQNVDEEIVNSVKNAMRLLEKMGHKVKKISLLDPKYAISDYTIIQRAEVSSNLGRYDSVRYGNDRSYFGEEAKRRIMLGTYTLAHGYYDAYYKKAQKVRTLIIEDFKKVFGEVDLIAAPTTPITAIKLGDFKKYPFFGETMDVLAEPGAMAGIPAISIPSGMDSKNLPIGLQFMAPQFEEGRLLDIAKQYEQETQFHGVINAVVDKWTI